MTVEGIWSRTKSSFIQNTNTCKRIKFSKLTNTYHISCLWAWQLLITKWTMTEALKIMKQDTISNIAYFLAKNRLHKSYSPWLFRKKWLFCVLCSYFIIYKFLCTQFFFISFYFSFLAKFISLFTSAFLFSLFHICYQHLFSVAAAVWAEATDIYCRAVKRKSDQDF